MLTIGSIYTCCKKRSLVPRDDNMASFKVLGSAPIAVLLFWNFFCILVPVKAQQVNSKIEKQIKDFNILKTALLENEAGLYLYNDSTYMLNKFSEVEQYINSPRTDLQLYRTYSSLLAEIKCGHTQIFPSRNIMKDFFSQASTLPFDVKLVNKKLYAFKNYGKHPKISKNDEIISINKESIVSLLEEMHQYIPSDGNNTTFKDRQLGKYFLLYYYFIKDIPQTFQLEFLNKDGDTIPIDIQPVFPVLSEYKAKDDKIKPDKKEMYGTLKIMKAANYGLLNFPSFEKSSGRKHRKFIDEAFEKINKSGIEHLIIDLRDNYGGKNQYYLTSYLAKSELKYDFITCKGNEKPSYNKYLKKLNKDYVLCRLAFRKNNIALKKGRDRYLYSTTLQRRQEGFNGQIYVLINGNSFSAASNLASNLKEKCNAIIIGEESGGGYKQGNTGRLRLKLPKSEFMVIINPIYFNNVPKNQNEKNDGVSPHFKVTEDYPYRKNSDPYVKTALKLVLDAPENKEKRNKNKEVE